MPELKPLSAKERALVDKAPNWGHEAIIIGSFQDGQAIVYPFNVSTIIEHPPSLVTRRFIIKYKPNAAKNNVLS